MIDAWLCLLAVSLAQTTAASPPVDASYQPPAGERQLLGVLAGLASLDAAERFKGIEAAAATRQPFFDEPLARLLRVDESLEVRRAAAVTLGNLAWPLDVALLERRVDALAEACGQESATVRQAALQALGLYPLPAVKRLLELQRRSCAVEDQAALDAALAALRSPAALARLSEWMGGGIAPVPASWAMAEAGRQLLADPENATGAVEVLGRGPARLVRPLVRFAVSAGPLPVRLRGLRLFVAQPDLEDVPALLEALGDPVAEVRQLALEALAAHPSLTVTKAVAVFMAGETEIELLQAGAAVLRLQADADLGQVLPAVLRQSESYARDLWIFVLRERPSRETLWGRVLAFVLDGDEEALARLLEEPADWRAEVIVPRLGEAMPGAERAALLRLLRGVADPEVLLAALSADAEPEIISAAGSALVPVADEVVVARLREVLAGAEAPQRAAAYELLRERGTPLAQAAMAWAIEQEPDPELAYRMLSRIEPSSAPELLAAATARLSPDEPAVVVAGALHALGGVDDPRLGARLLAVARHGAGGRDEGEQWAGRENAVTAVERLAALSPPGGGPELRELARDPGLPRELRLAVIEQLAWRGERADMPLFEGLLDHDDGAVRGAARHALHYLAPERYPEWDQLGRYPLVLGTAALGTTMLLVSTNIAESRTGEDIKDVSEVLIGVTGAALGGGTTWLLTLESDVSTGEAGYFLSLAGWSTIGGYSLARVGGFAERDPVAAQWGILAGELVGAGVGALTMRAARFGLGDVVLANFIAASVGAGAMSAAHLGRWRSEPAGLGDVFVLGSLAAMVPMVILSPRLELDDEAFWGVVVSTSFASWVGAFAPRAIYAPRDRRRGDVWAGLGLGGAIGIAGGLALGQATEMDGEAVAWGMLGALAGAGAGAGYGITDRQLGDRWTYRLLELGTLTGAAALALAGPRLEISDGDLGLILMMMGGGALLGARVPESLAAQSSSTGIDEGANKREKWGGAMLGSSLGLFVGLGATQLVDPSGGDLALSAAGATVLGTGFAGLTLLVPEIGRSQFSPMFSAGAAAGLLGLGAYLAPKLRYEPADISLGLSSAAIGSFLGAYLPAYGTAEGRALPDSEQIGGAMLGGALGLLFAGTVSQFTDVDPRRVLRVDVGALGGMAAGAGLGLVLPASLTPDYDRRLTVGLMQAGAVTGYAIATVTERKRTYTSADRWHLAVGATLGAWHGALVPFLWRDGDDSVEREVPDHEIAGGALLGLAVGGGATRLALRFHSLDEADLGELVLFDLFGTALGLGFAGALPDGDRRLRLGLIDGVGLAALVAGELLVSQTSYSPADRTFVASLTGLGAFGGLGLPYLILDRRPNGTELAAGAAGGAGLAGLAALGLAQVTEFERDDLFEAALLAATLGAGAWGAGRATDGVGPLRRWRLADAGWFGGLALGLAVAPHTETSTDDRIWVGSGMLLGSFVGALLPRAVDGDDASDARLAGGALAGAAAGAVATAAVMQWVEAPGVWAVGADSVALASSLVAGGLALMGVPARAEQDALSMQLAAVGGFAVAGLIAPRTRMSLAQFGTIGTFAALGAWEGLFLPEALELEADNAAWGGVVTGTGGGMLLGYGLAQLLPLDGDDNLELGWSALVGSLVGGGVGLLADDSDTSTARGVGIGGLVGTGLGLGLSRSSIYRKEAMPFIAVSGMWGAWHGLWLGDALVGELTAERARGGGAMLGLGAGLALGSLAGQWASFRLDEMLEATAIMGSGNLLGTGAGKLFALDDPTTTALLELGGLGGLAAGLWLAERTSYSTTDTTLVLLGAGIGAGHGALLGRAMTRDGEGERIGGGALFGLGLGAVTGMAWAQLGDLDAYDLTEVGLTVLAGDAVGAGLATWLELDGQAMAGTVAATGVGLATLGLLTAETTSFDRGDRILTLLGMSYGAWLGGWAPLMWHGEGEAIGGDVGMGILAGAGGGMLVGGALSQLVDYRLGDIGEISFGTTAGSLLGAGVGLLASPDSDLWVGLMEATGVAGAVATASIAKRSSFKGSDAFLAGLASLYGLYQGAGLSLLVDANDQQVAGAMMTAGAVGALTGAYFGRYLDLDATEIWMLLAGSAWGVWIGIWSAAAIDRLDVGQQENPFFLGVGTTAVATDLTLTATSIAISELVDMPPKQFAWISVAGGVGLVGGLLGSYLSGKAISPYLGIAAGSAGGLALGTLITGFFSWDQPIYGALPVDESVRGRRWGFLPDVEWWYPSVAVLPVGDAEGLAPVRGTQVLLTVTGATR